MREPAGGRGHSGQSGHSGHSGRADRAGRADCLGGIAQRVENGKCRAQRGAGRPAVRRFPTPGPESRTRSTPSSAGRAQRRQAPHPFDSAHVGPVRFGGPIDRGLLGLGGLRPRYWDSGSQHQDTVRSGLTVALEAASPNAVGSHCDGTALSVRLPSPPPAASPDARCPGAQVPRCADEDP